MGDATSVGLGTTRLMCSMCGTYHDIDMLRHIWVDPECMQAVDELSYELKKIMSQEPEG